MKTTLELPDELMRAAKIRAAQEGRTLKDVIGEFIKRGLAEPTVTEGQLSRKVRLPLVRCAHKARPSDEMTPDKVADILAAEEAANIRRVL